MGKSNKRAGNRIWEEKKELGKGMRDCVRPNLELPRDTTLLTVQNLIHYS